MRCEACSHVVDLKVKNKRFWCKKLGMYVYPRSNGYGREQVEAGADCHWFTLEVTDEEPPYDLYP